MLAVKFNYSLGLYVTYVPPLLLRIFGCKIAAVYVYTVDACEGSIRPGTAMQAILYSSPAFQLAHVSSSTVHITPQYIIYVAAKATYIRLLYGQKG